MDAPLDKVETTVVGAGVVGLAIARALALTGREVLVLERGSGIGQETSSRNSEVIHAGLYYPSGSLRAKFCVEGRRALYRYCEERGVPHSRCGKLVVAANDEEVPALGALHQRALANGVEAVELIDRSRLEELEPALAGTRALHSGSTGIVDGHALMLAYQGDAENAGALVQCAAPVLGGSLVGGSLEGGATRLSIGGDDPTEIETRLVINAAGLSAWELSRNLTGLDPSTIPPRYLAKGCYFTLTGRAPFRHLIYPVPPEGGLGTHLTFDLGGQVRFGPDVEWVEDVDYRVDPSRGAAFYGAIRRYWPGLPDGSLEPDYAGIRPRTYGPGEPAADFVIQGPRETGHRGYVALYGIDSPGLTSSLAIGDHVARLASGR
ncbi:NAD(P)/FAD-dependent oxidoreductase [Methyloceanibacter sp. wino2]|uniref:NAD(P)/FAD-dependent oxidoreductase n=1 Tax=Methyloceanibacter sp. wino2 TaxID=2170729 RepID=UPI001FDF36AA|nr:NAD(P)/FAD-dependent oxidoreductase [Methyloceanibacter sp. wino2]